MFYKNEELRTLARKELMGLAYCWETISFDTSQGKFWGEYSWESVHRVYRWVLYVFSKDPQELDARDPSNYMNRFDEPEYLGRMVLT